MTDKKGKRAVIISNIRSRAIEQAIFILRSPDGDTEIDAGNMVIAEAQDIINSYIRRIEGAMPDRRRMPLTKKVIAAGAVLLVIVTTAVIYGVLKA